uniref:EOG090X0EYV n=1 Tax=Megafenestra aurita TaxID=2291010 RepID=A0A4Y7NIH4_9CRUS|nr:EOG090X0EYV [Megafenestra aurita]SVE92693.1 EOG090X0EYV [Megafenestra aurita]
MQQVPPSADDKFQGNCLCCTALSTAQGTVSLETKLQKDAPKKRNNEIGPGKYGGQEFQGFTYFPRFPGQVDPEFEPPKVYMVQRIERMKFNPFWHKKLLKEFGIDRKSSDYAIVPNTPNNCARLWKVKHLVRITPISIPQGLPEDGDMAGARLQDNGELRFIPKLKHDMLVSVNQSRTAKQPDFLDHHTLKNRLRMNWLKPW